MVLDNKDSTIYLAQKRLAQWGGEIVETSVRQSRKLQIKAEKLRYFLHAIQYEEFLDDEDIISLLQCINQLAGLDSWPTAPVLTEKEKPVILQGGVGTAGQDGATGPAGSDANIDVLSGDTIIVVVESNPGGVKTFTITYEPYVLPTVVVSINTSAFPNANSLIQELGATVASVPFTSTLNKGKDTVDSSTVLDPTAMNGTYQAALDLVNLNAGNEEVVTIYDTNLTADQAYTTEIDDLTNQPTSTKLIEFVVPFLYGDSTALLVQATFYSNLTRIIEKQGNKIVTFDAEDSYFYLMYPATYPDLDKILDGNGFDAIDAFTKTTENADMLSGVVSMKVYKTIITDIPDQDYTMIF